jgi:AraC-like DNA-binding protein
MHQSQRSTNIPILYSQMLIRETKSCDYELNDIIENTNLSLKTIENSEHTISPQTQNIILDNVLKKTSRSPTEIAFNLGEKLHLSSHGTIGILLFSCPNIQCLLEDFVSYASYSLPFGMISLAENNTHLILKLSDVLPKLHHQFYYETAASNIQKVLEDFLGTDVNHGSIHFPYKPDNPMDYHKHFNHPVCFSSPTFEYHIAKEVTLKPSISYNVDLYQYTKILCEKRINDHENNRKITEEIRTLLYSSHSKNWKISDVSKKMNISERSLCRKLQHEGTSYKSIYDDVKKSLVQHYLINKELSINEIIELLGFSDQSNFRRIFKRWFNMSPKEYILFLNKKD